MKVFKISVSESWFGGLLLIGANSIEEAKKFVKDAALWRENEKDFNACVPYVEDIHLLEEVKGLSWRGKSACVIAEGSHDG